MQAVRIRQNGNSLAVTLPSTYISQLGWQLGDYLVLEIVERHLEVRPILHYFQPSLRIPTETTEVDNAAT
jgi:antitoxin component of MazEF toxin-antitoxin module